MVGTNLMGSDHTYVIPPAAAPGATPAPRVAPGQKRCAALRTHAPVKAGCQRIASVLRFSLLCCDGDKADTTFGLWYLNPSGLALRLCPAPAGAGVLHSAGEVLLVIC